MKTVQIETADQLRAWLTKWDAEGFALTGTPEHHDKPRRIEGIAGGRRENATVPAHVFAAIRNDLLWLHDDHAGILPTNVIFALRGKYHRQPAAGEVTAPDGVADPLIPARA